MEERENKVGKTMVSCSLFWCEFFNGFFGVDGVGVE